MRRLLNLTLAFAVLGCTEGPVSVSFPGHSDTPPPKGQVPISPAQPESRIVPTNLELPLEGREGASPGGILFGGGGAPVGQGVQADTKLSAQIRIETGSNRGRIRLDIQVPRADKQPGKGRGFKTKAIEAEEIAFVDVTVTGIGLSQPIQGALGPLAVPPDGRVSVDLEVPTGVNRIVTLSGQSGSHQLIPGSVIKGLLDVTPSAPANAEVSWRTHVTGLILERLIQLDPLLASLVRAGDLQTQVDGVTRPSGDFPYAFVVHPSLLQPEKWADQVVAANVGTPPGSQPLLPAPNGVTLVPGEVTGVLDGLLPGTEIAMGAKDPASKPLAITVTGSNQSYRLSGITPGTWPFWFSMNGQTWLRSVQVPVGGSFSLDWRSPVASAMSPSHAAAGATIRVSGRNFGDQGDVTVGGVNATVTDWTDTQLNVVVPGGVSGTAGVVVRRDDFGSQAIQMGILAGAPQLTRINPTGNSLNVPRSIVLTGNNYSPIASENQVKMVSATYTYLPDVTLVNSTNLAFSSPNVVGTYAVTVSVGGLTSQTFTYSVTP